MATYTLLMGDALLINDDGGLISKIPGMEYHNLPYEAVVAIQRVMLASASELQKLGEAAIQLKAGNVGSGSPSSPTRPR